MARMAKDIEEWQNIMDQMQDRVTHCYQCLRSKSIDMPLLNYLPYSLLYNWQNCVPFPSYCKSFIWLITLNFFFIVIWNRNTIQYFAKFNNLIIDTEYNFIAIMKWKLCCVKDHQTGKYQQLCSFVTGIMHERSVLHLFCVTLWHIWLHWYTCQNIWWQVFVKKVKYFC